jgi:UDP-N-acetylglucosamine transferase subunit ALG13
MKSNFISSDANPMATKRILYFDLVEQIDQYIQEVGITKASADILTVLANRLNDKLRIIGPLKDENESHVP